MKAFFTTPTVLPNLNIAPWSKVVWTVIAFIPAAILPPTNTDTRTAPIVPIFLIKKASVFANGPMKKSFISWPAFLTSSKLLEDLTKLLVTSVIAEPRVLVIPPPTEKASKASVARSDISSRAKAKV